MSTVAASPLPRCRLERPPVVRTLEFIAFRFPPGGAFSVGWPIEPGGVRLAEDDRPVLLHFAPGRWLLPEPGADINALVAAAVEAGAGTVVDVSGRWQPLELTGPGAHRLLAGAVDTAAVLGGRGCAALTIFDCPVVLARRADGFALWVQASYAHDLVAAIERHQAPG